VAQRSTSGYSGRIISAIKVYSAVGHNATRGIAIAVGDSSGAHSRAAMTVVGHSGARDGQAVFIDHPKDYVALDAEIRKPECNITYGFSLFNDEHRGLRPVAHTWIVALGIECCAAPLTPSRSVTSLYQPGYTPMNSNLPSLAVSVLKKAKSTDRFGNSPSTRSIGDVEPKRLRERIIQREYESGTTVVVPVQPIVGWRDNKQPGFL